MPDSVNVALANANKMGSGFTSEIKSDMKQSLVTSTERPKNNFANNGLMSEFKQSEISSQKQSFMNRISQAAPVKDVSFGGPQSFGVNSGMHSSRAAAGQDGCNNVIPITESS